MLRVGKFECKLNRSRDFHSFWQLNWAFPSVTVTEQTAARSLAGSSTAPPPLLPTWWVGPKEANLSDRQNMMHLIYETPLRSGEEKKQYATPSLPLAKLIAPAMWSIFCLEAWRIIMNFHFYSCCLQSTLRKPRRIFH